MGTNFPHLTQVLGFGFPTERRFATLQSGEGQDDSGLEG
jgi:hypothetical protein